MNAIDMDCSMSFLHSKGENTACFIEKMPPVGQEKRA